MWLKAKVSRREIQSNLVCYFTGVRVLETKLVDIRLSHALTGLEPSEKHYMHISRADPVR